MGPRDDPIPALQSIKTAAGGREESVGVVMISVQLVVLCCNQSGIKTKRTGKYASATTAKTDYKLQSFQVM